MSARKKRIIIIACLAFVATVALCFSPVVEFLRDNNILKPQPKGDYLAVLSVGEADAILVHSDNKTALIDTGDINDAGNALAVKLKRAGIEKIDTLIVTHSHTDHAGGLYSVLTQFDVDCFYYQSLFAQQDAQDDYFSQIRKIVRQKQIKTGIIKEDMTFQIGKFDFYVLASSKSGIGSDENDASAVLKAECNGKSFLLMADAGEYTERYILKKYGSLECDVLKVGHHGSDTASSDLFIKTIKPRYAAISCGDENTYGHPSKETVKRLEKYNANILRTDIHGDIYFYVENSKIRVESLQ